MTDQSMKIFFVLGGPGSGKGTNCARLVKEFGYKHLCAGDLLREAAKSGTTDVAKQIAEILRSGNIVPSEITVELLRQAMASEKNAHGYLLDGFPRKADQAQMFEQGIAKAKAILYFDCTEATMESRLLGRAVSEAARDDDNIETIRNRFRVNVEQCMPVVKGYQAEGRCHIIDSNQGPEQVYADVRKTLIQLGEVPL